MRFSDIAGHEHVKELLRRAVRYGRLPHAYLFYGPDGVGKRSTALALYAFLECEDPQPQDSCGVCASCQRVDSLLHPDLHLVSPSGTSIGIEAVRSVVSTVIFEPFEGDWKAVVIDNAHLMTLEAANAALKTLEEPPPKTLFVLVTPCPDLLPRTVISRTFQVAFGPVPNQDIEAVIRKRRPEAREEEIYGALSLARGSVGMALSALDSEAVRERRDFLMAFLSAPREGVAERLRFSEGLVSQKGETSQYLRLIASVLSDLCLIAAGLEPTANPDLIPEMKAFLDDVGLDGLLEMIEAFAHWDTHARYHPYLRAALDRMLLSFP